MNVDMHASRFAVGPQPIASDKLTGGSAAPGSWTVGLWATARMFVDAVGLASCGPSFGLNCNPNSAAHSPSVRSAIGSIA